MDYDLIITLVWIVALVVWTFMFMRYKIFKANKRAEIVTALVEKNPDADIDELLKKISPKSKLLKEKLLMKLLWGSILSFLGIALIVWGSVLYCMDSSDRKNFLVPFFGGIILLGIGIAFYINYFVGKKMLAKEIEAEEKKMLAEAESK